VRAIDHISQRLQQAAMEGIECGQSDLAYAAACKLDVPLAEEKGVRIMFLRHLEFGRRFFALSLSFRNFKTNQPLAFEHPFARKVAPVFFGRRVADTLVTAPLNTPDGRKWQIWCWRLFADAQWRPLDHKPLITPADVETLYTWDEYYRKEFPQ
jgi:hypothetical protein